MGYLLLSNGEFRRTILERGEFDSFWNATERVSGPNPAGARLVPQGWYGKGLKSIEFCFNQTISRRDEPFQDGRVFTSETPFDVKGTHHEIEACGVG